MTPSSIESYYSEFEPVSMRDTFPIQWKRAHGSHVWDANGKRYIDFTSGIFVANVGHSNPTVKKYLQKQIESELWFAFAFPTEIRKQFIDELISMCPPPLDACCLFSEGSIANEAAIKLAKAYTGKTDILCNDGSYHGNTYMLKNLQGRMPFPSGKNPQYEKFLDQLSWYGKDNWSKAAAIIMEGYQGWAAYFYPKQYMKDVRKWCDDNNVLLIMDEIQSGFGRTGKMFCFEHYDIEPDMVVFGKGVSSSLPLSGVLGKRKVLDALNGKELISNTHSGNCLSVAAGLGALKALQKIKMSDIAEKGEFMMGHLRELERDFPTVVTLVTGRGLLAAVHFQDKDLCDRVTERCIKNGVMLVRTRKGTIKLGPPLVIPKRDIDISCKVIRKCIEEEIGLIES